MRFLKEASLNFFHGLTVMDQSDSKLRNFYANFINPDAIKTFVRESLGCKCEDSVFNQIVIGVPSIFSGENPGWDMQIMIGFRLLISFVPVQTVKPINEDINKMLKAGKELRDRYGLNRFRLVLLGKVKKELYEAFQKKTQGLDDRIHLHVVGI
jgi:hypothetical protein